MTHSKYGVKGKGKDEGDEIEKDFIETEEMCDTYSVLLFFLCLIKKCPSCVP